MQTITDIYVFSRSSRKNANILHGDDFSTNRAPDILFYFYFFTGKQSFLRFIWNKINLNGLSFLLLDGAYCRTNKETYRNQGIKHPNSLL